MASDLVGQESWLQEYFVWNCYWSRKPEAVLLKEKWEGEIYRLEESRILRCAGFHRCAVGTFQISHFNKNVLCLRRQDALSTGALWNWRSCSLAFCARSDGSNNLLLARKPMVQTSRGYRRHFPETSVCLASLDNVSWKERFVLTNFALTELNLM
jgi:hypothetical protein